MAAQDDLYVDLMFRIINVLKRLRITESFSNGNFLPSRGESVYSTFLRVIGFLRYSESIEQQIGVEKRVEAGKTIVDKLLKPKSEEAARRREVFASFLKSLLKQLEKYVRDVNLTQIKRIRKLIGPPVLDPRADSKTNVYEFTGDLATDIKAVNEQLQQYDQQRDGIGQLVQKIDLLQNFTSTLSAAVRDLFGANLSGEAQPLGPLGGPFVSLIRAQTSGYSQELDKLIDRRVALNSQLLILQNKMRVVRSGIAFLTGEQIALVNLVDTMVYLFTEIEYKCKQCRFYSTVPAEGSGDLSGIPEEQREAEQERIKQAQERAENIQEALREGDETGFCIYRAANLPTVDNGSCLSTWGLTGNNFWTASDNDEDGREDILSKVKERLDPRKK